jgi:urease accessory protein UreF
VVATVVVVVSASKRFLRELQKVQKRVDEQRLTRELRLARRDLPKRLAELYVALTDRV